MNFNGLKKRCVLEMYEKTPGTICRKKEKITEEEGFEPPVPLRAQRFSKPSHRKRKALQELYLRTHEKSIHRKKHRFGTEKHRF